MPDRSNWYYEHPRYCTCKDCEFNLPRSRSPLGAAIREIRLRAQRPVVLPTVVDDAIGRIKKAVKWNSKHEPRQ